MPTPIGQDLRKNNQPDLIAGSRSKSSIKINYPGTNNNSQFFYDPFGHIVQIKEVRSGSTTSNKQFVWDMNGAKPLEERDGSSNLLTQYFARGQVNYSGATATNYFYTKDHLGSAREMTDSTGTVQAAYNYDPYGRVTQVAGSQSSDFQYAGYYSHAPSGLNLTLNRAYSANLGRFINRDPIGETGGINLFAYVRNIPTTDNDPLGLIDSVTTTLAKALAANDVEELQLLLDSGGLNSVQTAKATNAIYKLTHTAQEILSKFCRGSVNREFPKSVLGNTGKEIAELAAEGDSDAITAQKLLNKLDFSK